MLLNFSHAMNPKDARELWEKLHVYAQKSYNADRIQGKTQ